MQLAEREREHNYIDSTVISDKLVSNITDKKTEVTMKYLFSICI